MPYPVYRLMAVALVLLAGCTTPMFSGVAKRGKPDSGALLDAEAAGPSSSALPRNSQIADRKPPDQRPAQRETSVPERQIADLLATASRSQQAGKVAVARNSYEQVLRLDPQNMTARYQLACIADDEGRFADAERQYAALLGQAPHNPDLLASLGWSYLLQGRHDDCERTLREALRYAPTHQTALYNLGWLYGTRGDYDQALAIFRAAGTESEAQRALAELQQDARRNLAATDDDSARRSMTSASSPGAARENLAGRSISAPTPWNDDRAGSRDPRLSAQGRLQTAGNQTGIDQGAQPVGNVRGGAPLRNERPKPVQFNGMFSEIDAFASSSPSQANHARQAEPQTQDVTADDGAPIASGARPGMEHMHYEQSAEAAGGRHGPVITPKNAGGGSAGPRPAVSGWNTLPTADNFPADAPTHSAAPRNAGDWPRTAPGTSSVPTWANGAGSGIPGEPSRGTVPPLRGQSRWQEAQTTAAQLGLGAGPGGTLFPSGDWSNPAAAADAGSQAAERVPDSAFGDAVRWPADGTATGQLPAASRPAPVRQAAGFAPAPAAGRGPLSSDLPPWPGRAASSVPLRPESAAPGPKRGGGPADYAPPALNPVQGR